MKDRKILATFFRHEDGRLELNHVSVLAACEYKLGPYADRHVRCRGHLTGYDVDWCKRDRQYVYHNSSGGGPLPETVTGIYWCSSGYPVKERAAQWCSANYEDGRIDAETRYIRARNRTRRLKQLPKEFRDCWIKLPNGTRFRQESDDLLDWLEHHGTEEDAVFCVECEDDFPGDDLCEHCWWCDSAGWYVTPSEGEPCFDRECYGCSNRRRRRHEKHWAEKRYQRFSQRMDAAIAAKGSDCDA